MHSPELSRKIVLQNVRVFDGSGFTDPETVVIDGEVIGNDSQGADETIDAHGRFLLPGLIDAHAHIDNESHLHKLIRFGVTTAMNMAPRPAATTKMNSKKKGLPSFRNAGLPATAPGSVHSRVLPHLPSECLLSGPEKAQTFVERRIAEGSDYIKLIADVPGPTQSTLTALASAAHARGKMAVAHAATFTPFNMALAAGVDIITHVPVDKALSTTATVMGRMVEGKVVSVPTLTMMEAVASVQPSLFTILVWVILNPWLFMTIMLSKHEPGEQSYEHARNSVTNMYRAGVPILAGTDCHEDTGSSSSVSNIKHGESLHRELELLVEAGLSTVDALRAATITAAQHFKLPDRGVVAEGKRADLLLLREDPIKNIRASRSIDRVWCGGVEYEDIALNKP